MAYWEVPNREEKEKIRHRGEEPDHTVVHRIGADGSARVLNMRTRNEFSIKVERKERNVL